MATSSQKIRYDIEAAVSGEGDVAALARQLEGLADTLEGDLKTQAQASALALRELGAKQGAIDNFVQLKKEAGDAAAKLGEAQSAAQKLGQSMAASGAPTRAQTGQLEKLRDAVRSAKTEVQAKTQALDNSRTTLRTYGVASDGVAKAEITTRQAIAAARAEVAKLAPAYTAAGNAAADSGLKQVQATATAGAGLRDLGNEMGKVDAKSSVLNTSLSEVGKAVAGLFALNKAVGFAKDTIALADAYGQMAERIAMATPVAEEYDLVQQRILATANLTYRSLDEQQEMYIRTADALRGMAYSTSEALDITDSFSYLLTTNAASAERGKNAIDAYTKSIQSGRIEVDAWQSIMSATPTIVNAVAQATGKTADEVRRLGITGKLSINELNEGLRQTVELNKQAAAGMSATVGDAITRLTNTWTQYIGEANRANQTTGQIASTIDLLSDNLGTVISLAVQAGEVMAVVWGIKALGALKAYMAQLALAAAETSAAMATVTGAGNKAAAGLLAAGKLAAAGWVGWEIGTYLKGEFEVVERAGIAAAAGLTRAAAQYQAAWEMAKAAFTSDTIAAAEQRLAERIAEIDDEYSKLFANVGKGMPKVAADTKKAGDAAAEAAKQVRDWEAAQVEAWEAARVAKVGDAQAAEANLQVQLKLAQQSEQMALFMGNEYQARKAKILQMEIEIQLVNAAVAVQRAEAEGSIAVANAKLAEMATNKEVNLVKQAELETAIKLAQAKLAEADATGRSTELLNKQLALLRNGGSAADGYGGGLNRLSGSQRGLAGSIGEVNVALQRQNELLNNNRYSRPGQNSTQRGNEKDYDPGRGSPYARPGDPKPVNGNDQTQAEYQRGKRLAGQNAVDNTLLFELRDKLRAGTLTSADSADIRAAIAALDQNAQIDRDVDRMNPGGFSLEGMADRREWAAIRTQLAQTLEKTNVGRTVNVNLNTNGTTRTVPTTEEGAQALVATLKAASLAAGR